MSIKTILIKNARYIVTLNESKEVLTNASILIEGNSIKKIGTNISSAGVDEVVDAKNMTVFPGFINTHLHIPQVFHRHCPAQQNKPIAQWINVTTSINKEINAEAMYYGALVCFIEMMLSGVTTTSDYFYPFVKGKAGTMEATIKAAKDIGIRFTSIRGSMSQSRKNGSLYDEAVVEDSEKIIEHSEEMINKYHDNSKFSMLRIGAGPCLPFASIEKDFELAAELAKKHEGVILQTHTAESEWEVEYCKKKFGVTPPRLMEKTGFLGSHVGLVHFNIVTKDEIALIGKTKTNTILTPICNTRDASDGNGILPMTEVLKAGGNVSIGIDGPASNDSANMQDEMRYLRVVSKGKEGLYWYPKEDQEKYSYMNPMDTLDITNLGGAKTLNRDDIGSIEVGKAADIVIFDPDKEINHTGAINKWGSIMSCSPIIPKYSIVNGEFVIKNKQLKNINIEDAIKNFNKHQQRIIAAAEKNLKMNLYDY